MNWRARIKDRWNEQRIFAHRTVIAIVLVVALAALLIGRLFYLQVFRHHYYAALSQSNRVRIEPIPANRGLIFDRTGAVLAENEPAFQLELVREQVPNLSDTLHRLVQLGLLDPDSLDETRALILSRPSFDSVPVRLRLTDAEVSRFASHRFEFPGVDIATRQTRHYPYGPLLVHAIGYVGAISAQDLKHIDPAAYEGTTLIGKSGVESAYENRLHGHNGYRGVLVNAAGRPIQHPAGFGLQLPYQAPVAGDDLTLSIDLRTQQAAAKGLGNQNGAVVAIDPSNGNVLALVSNPGFDPDAFARGLTRRAYAALVDNPNKPLLDRALRGEYASGSTIKPELALGALEDHVVDPSHQIDCPGYYRLPGSRHLFREAEVHGEVDMVKAIAESCDVYFYGLAHTMGIKRIDTILSAFGFGRPTGIDIAGEKSGLLPSPAWKRATYKDPADQVWFPGDTVVLGIGQGYLLVTPLQMAHVAAILAERGRSFRPRLVIGITAPHGHYRAIPPVPLPGVTGISAADWKVVVSGMVGATQYGTAAATGRKTSYPFAGKTGTAQVFTIAQNENIRVVTRHETKKERDDAWFIAFAPVVHPLIAVAVLVEHAGFGADAAAPIARKVMNAYLLKDGMLRSDQPPIEARADGH